MSEFIQDLIILSHSHYNDILGSDMFTFGVICMICGLIGLFISESNNMDHSAGQLNLKIIIGSGIALIFVFHVFSPLRLFLLGISVTIIPGIGVIMIYYLMEVPIR